MAAQASSNVPQDEAAVVELDGERRARKNLLDASYYFKRRFLNILRSTHFGNARSASGSSIANSDGWLLSIFQWRNIIDRSKDRA